MLRLSALEASLGPSACVLGSFDGVHMGHQALLCRARMAAAKNGLKTVAVTFRQHPLSVLAPERMPELLSTEQERARCMECLGMDALVELEFTKTLADQQPEDFIRQLVECLQIQVLVVGYNYTFGRGGRGNPQLLEKLASKLNFTLYVIEPVLQNGEPVSSSRIRELLTRGATMEAARLLGYPYSLEGEIKRGKQLGRKLGFPTLNIDFPAGKAVPSAGVYTGWIRYTDGCVPAVTNIGTNPTVEDGPKIRLEAHALEPIPLVYGDRAAVLFGEKLRGEQRFASVEDLRERVLLDREAARKWSREHPMESLDFGGICP